MEQEVIWVFHSAGARFSGGVFTTVEIAEKWIQKHNLTGLLTAYPLNTGVFEWAIENQMFNPKNEKQETPEFIGGFTSASQDHLHYENGKQA